MTKSALIRTREGWVPVTRLPVAALSSAAHETAARRAPLQPIPRESWPLWAKILALDARPDTGLGDIVVRRIGPTNSAAFKKWHRKWFGTDCGCERRQVEWNARYPL